MPKDCRKDTGKDRFNEKELRNGIPGEGNSLKKSNQVTKGTGLTGMMGHDEGQWNE